VTSQDSKIQKFKDSKIQRFKIQDSKFKIQDSRFKVQCRGVLQPPSKFKIYPPPEGAGGGSIVQIFNYS